MGSSPTLETYQLTAKVDVSSARKSAQNNIATNLKKTLPDSRRTPKSYGTSYRERERFLTLADSTAHRGVWFHSTQVRFYCCLLLEGWPHPRSCQYGTGLTTEHALSCPKGGFPSLCHNEIHDLTANPLPHRLWSSAPHATTGSYTFNKPCPSQSLRAPPTDPTHLVVFAFLQS